MELDDHIYYQIAVECKDKLRKLIGGRPILPHEWFVLKKHDFPFNLSENDKHIFMFALIEIDKLDSSPLIYLLKRKFKFQQDVDDTDIKNIRDYAWSHILSSTSYVWGG